MIAMLFIPIVNFDCVVFCYLRHRVSIFGVVAGNKLPINEICCQNFWGLEHEKNYILMMHLE